MTTFFPAVISKSKIANKSMKQYQKPAMRFQQLSLETIMIPVSGEFNGTFDSKKNNQNGWDILGDDEW